RSRKGGNYSDCPAGVKNNRKPMVRLTSRWFRSGPKRDAAGSQEPPKPQDQELLENGAGLVDTRAMALLPAVRSSVVMPLRVGAGRAAGGRRCRAQRGPPPPRPRALWPAARRGGGAARDPPFPVTAATHTPVPTHATHDT